MNYLQHDGVMILKTELDSDHAKKYDGVQWSGRLFHITGIINQIC